MPGSAAVPRHCLVTGANRGLGLEFVRQLLARGDRVVATCRHPGRATALNALAGEHPGRLQVLPLDVAVARSREELVRELPLVLDGARIDLLINTTPACCTAASALARWPSPTWKQACTPMPSGRSC